MRYRPRTRPGFYYRSSNKKRDIIRVDAVFDGALNGEESTAATWWVYFIGTLTDFDDDGPSERVKAASWEMPIYEFSGWRRWPKDKPLPLKWQDFFDRNPS